MSNISIRKIRRLLNDTIAAQAKREAEAAKREAEAAERDAEAAKRDAKWKSEMIAAREAEAAERKAWVAEQERLLALSKKEADEGFKQLRQELGSHGASHGEFVESMFVNLDDKFNKLGYSFPREARGAITFRDENRRVVAEVDRLLENGEAMLAVEVKAKLKIDHVHDHIKRLGKISDYNKKHNDNRKLLGAVAGGIVHDNVKNYAHENGLFVLVLNGENVSIADLPQNFKPHEWPVKYHSDIYEVSTS